MSPAPSAKPGSSHEGHGFSLWNWPGPGNPNPNVGFGFTVLNFAVLLVVLEFVMFRRLRTGQREQHASVRAELERATTARREAEALVAEYGDRFARLEGEIAEMKQAASERAEAERRKVLAEAEAEAGKIRAAAVAAGEREGLARRREIERETVDLAVTRAETLLRERFTDGDQHRLVGDFVAKVGTLPLGGSSPR